MLSCFPQLVLHRDARRQRRVSWRTSTVATDEIWGIIGALYRSAGYQFWFPINPVDVSNITTKMGEIVAWLNNWQFFGIQEYWGVGFGHLCPTRMEVIWECSSVEKNTTARGSDSKFASLCVGRSEYTEQQDFDTHQSFEVVASLTFALAVFVAQSFAVPRCGTTWGDTLRPLKPLETPLFWPKFSVASASFDPHPVLLLDVPCGLCFQAWLWSETQGSWSCWSPKDSSEES